MPQTLDPCAFALTMQADKLISSQEWSAFLVTRLSDFANRLARRPGVLIGHIKLRGFGPWGHIDASVVDARIVPAVNATLHRSTAEIRFDLVCLVYGVSPSALASDLEAALTRQLPVTGIRTGIKALPAHGRFDLVHPQSRSRPLGVLS